MRITIAVPACNAAKYLRRCISGIKELDPKPDEILIVDDGSTDDTGKILKDIQGIETITHQENKGLASARNTALYKCDSDVIIYFDSDTIPDKNFLKEIMKHYSSGDVAGVGGRAVESEIKSIWDKWRCTRMRQEHESEGGASFLWGLCSSYRVSVLRDAGGFDTTFRTNGEDVEMGARLSDKGYKLVYEPSAKALHFKQDTFVSLVKAVFRWYYWGIIALKKNGKPYLKDYLKIILKNPLRPLTGKEPETLHPALVAFDALAFFIELGALFSALISRAEK